MTSRASRYRRALQGKKPRLLLSGAAASLAGYTALAVLATHQQFFALDYGTRAWVHMLRTEALHLPMALVTELGDFLGLVALIGVAMLLLWWRGQTRWALALPVLMAGAGALQWLAKWAAGRARPDQTPWGFPSGHVLSLVVFFGLMAWLVVTASQRRRRWRIAACAVCAVAVALVAFSRLYLERHWLSDLAGGATIGLAYLLLAIWVVEVLTVDRTIIPARGSAASTEEP